MDKAETDTRIDPTEVITRSAILIAMSDERSRQSREEGFDTAHDDQLTGREIALMAASYAAMAAGNEMASMAAWPWDDPAPASLGADPRRCLIIAGALILAEIERLDRAAAKTQEATHG